ncbi:hypothetical protein NL676_025067 [Syzygium grande]|nr:hypothetical protein NL676_025067 [Syzygium grande]
MGVARRNGTERRRGGADREEAEMCSGEIGLFIQERGVALGFLLSKGFCVSAFELLWGTEETCGLSRKRVKRKARNPSRTEPFFHAGSEKNVSTQNEGSKRACALYTLALNNITVS